MGGGQGAKTRIPLLEEERKGIFRTLELIEGGEEEIEVGSKLYNVINDFVRNQINVDTKYKTVDRKVKPAAVPLPLKARELIKRAKEEPRLRDSKNTGHVFTEETLQQVKIGGDGLLTEVEEKAFRKMISNYGKAFSFCIEEIGCVNP